jgi:hypothetical protein
MGTSINLQADPNKVTAQLAEEFNKSFKLLGTLVNYQRNLLIYRLVKKGLITKSNIAAEAGLSVTKIYDIINFFDQKTLNL